MPRLQLNQRQQEKARTFGAMQKKNRRKSEENTAWSREIGKTRRGDQ